MLGIKKFRHDSILEKERSDQEPKKLYFLKESNIKSQNDLFEYLK